MAITYKQVNAKDKSFLSEEIRARLLGTRYWVYAAMDEEAGTWCGYLVISMVGGMPDTMQIQGIYVKPDYRRQKIGTRLFETAEADALSVGAKRFYFKDIHETRGGLWENVPFCERLGFTMISSEEIVDYYDGRELAKNERLPQMLKTYARLPIKAFSSFDAPAVKSWKKRLNQSYLFFDEESTSPAHSRFYVDNGEIRGASAVQVIRSFQAVLTGLYADEDLNGMNKELVRLMLKVSCIDSVLHAGCNKIYILSRDTPDRKSLTELLGAPVNEYHAVEWTKAA